MTDIHAVIAELKTLEAKATPGRWDTSDDAYEMDPRQMVNI